MAIFILAGGSYFLSQLSNGQTTGAGPTTQGGGKGGRKGGRGGGGPIPVAAEKVKKGNMGVYINALGTVTPVYTVSITSRVGGQLMEVHYREGQIVQKGDLLATIDARPYQAAYEQAMGQLQRDQALLANARIDLERYRSAYEQHAIPQQTMATQESLINQDEGIVKLDQGNVDAAKVNVDYARITAPITGRVGLRPVDPGNIVAANGTIPLLTITQLQPITVVFTMAEDYIHDVATQLRAGHTLRVDALDRDNSTHLAQGTLLTLDNMIDTTTGTVKVKANFANSDFRLFPNEFVNAKLLVKTLSGVNIIPIAAIQRNNDISFVYVINESNSTVKSRNVTIAATDGAAAAVTGVTNGETLVTDGFDKLQDGVKIAIRAPRSTRPGADSSGGGVGGGDQ
ncbi:MAG TPA: efflux RND transporter periplasmic adaptor subunit [Bryobacteraceae bacterium]|nr:efflux RND transporter periplasmic adaptor subunit [Bryobacteraceae bacterium]